MSNNLSGKKLLILGAYKTEIEIINCARKMGIYTVVTDNHTNWEEAPAKFVADEAWDISWSNIESLSKKCYEESIDGVMAGFSEKRVANAQKLSRKINKPFYTDGADLDTILNKGSFKTACQQAGIDVAKHYDENDVIQYPVIVKPTDNGGSRGISICYTSHDLEEGIINAKNNSESGCIEIEEYIVADEVMIYYVVHNGIATLSAMCDRYMHSFDKKITQLPVGYKYPSKHLTLFKEKHDKNFQRLIHNLGIQNGLIAFQSFVNDTRVIPFDPTYRLDGTMAYHSTESINDSNVLQMLITYSLTGTMGNDDEISSKENPEFKKIAFELPVLLGKGMIHETTPINSYYDVNDVIFVHQGHDTGDTMNLSADFSQILCRIQLVADNEDDLETKLSELNSKIIAKSDNGEDMVLYRNPFALAYNMVER